ncbi:MAG: nucleoside triphosphate pyrophosphohydrolase [Spirochaetia bacterium]|nr:nucleoside triphosphate pyrophosphohydrolase [Spirochaetia bacterium]
MKKPPSLDKPIESLKKIARDLRDKTHGCPWDMNQTHDSVVKNLIEETYEVVDAIEKLNEKDINTYNDLKEELGDLFFQIVFHAQLAEERGMFNLEDTALYVSEKLIFRHPHVYGENVQVEGEKDVLKNWEKLKREEKNKKNEEFIHMLSGIPVHLPALLKSYRIGQKVSRVNFDWPSSKEGTKLLKEKVIEELNEFLVEIDENHEKYNPENLITADKIKEKERVEEELGDLLFAISQLARRYYIDPEEALQKANKKVTSRFEKMETIFQDKLNKGIHPSIEEWDELWKKVKKEEK